MSRSSEVRTLLGYNTAMAESEAPRYHVSPSVNRESIRRFGLDWSRMEPDHQGIARGWPGLPETDGIFLTAPDIEDARWFARMGSGRRVDIWRVDVSGLLVEEHEGGWWVCRDAIPSSRLRLVEVWDTVGDKLRHVPLSVNDAST
jgi:hypothetical protein